MQHLYYFFLFAGAFLSAIIFLPIIIKSARTIGFLEANNERKVHTENVSSLGGIAIMMATVIAIAIIAPPTLNGPVKAFALGLPLLVIGIIDDISGIGISVRIVVQVLVGILLFEMGFQVYDFGNLWPLSMGTTVLFVMLFINAYNFIDGINGLGGSLGLVASIIFGWLFLSSGKAEMAAACFAYAGGLAGFLVFNFGKKAKIFMGDNGSTVLGLFMAIMFMTVLKNSSTASGGSPWPILLAITGIPIVDLFKVTLQRVFKFRSPFEADRTHVHHLFVDCKISHPIACYILAGWSLVFVVMTTVFSSLISIPVAVLFLTAPYVFIKGFRLLKTQNKNQTLQTKRANGNPEKQNIEERKKTTEVATIFGLN